MTLAMKETKALPLLAAYPFAAAHGLSTEADRIRNMSVGSSVRRGHFAYLFRQSELLDRFIQEHWSYGSTKAGVAKLKYYEHLRQRDIEPASEEGHEDESPDEEEAAAQGFALEADLRDYLANNLPALEAGLRLHEADGQTGVEYPIDGGFIDILAVDRQDKFVVIELKLSRGRNRALGQLLYYMGWVDSHLGKAPCRGIIVASDIPDDLRTAVQRVPGVTLARYRIAMSIEQVSSRREF